MIKKTLEIPDSIKNIIVEGSEKVAELTEQVGVLEGEKSDLEGQVSTLTTEISNAKSDLTDTLYKNGIYVNPSNPFSYYCVAINDLAVAKYNIGFSDANSDIPPNGKVWTRSNITSTVSIVKYANGIWVAGCENGLLYSTDGITWTQSDAVTGLTNCVHNVNYMWVAGGDYGLYYSTDGVTWTQSNITSTVSIVEYGNGVWVCCCPENGLLYSTDGITWTQSEFTSAVNDIQYADNIWVAIDDNYLYYSTDGITWTQSNITSSQTFQFLHNVDGVWIVKKKRMNPFYSTDGISWSGPQRINTTLSSATGYSVAHINGVWVVATDSGLFYSEDFTKWAQSNVTSTVSFVKCANGICIADGMYYSVDGMSWSSTEGITTNTGVNYIHNANGVWVICFYKYSLYCSHDGGITFNNRLDSCNMVGVHNANGIWVAWGDVGLYYSKSA